MNEKKLLKHILVIFIMSIWSVTVFAQSRSVTGVVLDDIGEPMIGVSVIEKGTGNGTITDLDGKFKISNLSENSVLSFSFVGYIQQEITIGTQTTLEVTMSEDIESLEEIVVIGYGTAKRSELTGSISSVSSKTIAQTPVSNAAEAIKGRLPGVQITTQDGSPDSQIKILIRGGSSITQSNDPLILVDGFPVSDFNDIPPTDIESIDVLKDASATAIYGSSGANGVVIVTTKGASAEGGTKVTFNSYLQWRTLSKKLDVMDNYEFSLLWYELQSLRGESYQKSFIKDWGHPEDLYIYKGNPGNDWQNDVLGRTALSQYYNLAVQGGSEKTRYNLSVTYNDDEGIIPTNDYSRANINLKINHALRKNLRLNLNTRFVNTVTNGKGTDGASPLSALLYRPSDGLNEYMDLPPEDLNPDEEEYSPSLSPVQNAYANYRKRTDYRLTGNVALDWDIITDLRFRSELNMNLNLRDTDDFWDETTSKAINESNSKPMVSVVNRRTPGYQFTNTLFYTLPFENHKVDVLFGQELRHSRTYDKSLTVVEFPEEYTAEDALANLGIGERVKEQKSTWGGNNRKASFFTRLNYNYQGKYLASFTFRADGSSKFAPGHRWAYFPAGALAWRLSEEDFLKKYQILSNLKLRASYGVAGNDGIGDDLWQQLYSINNSNAIAFGEVSNNYYSSSSGKLPNPLIKWETSYTRNLGLDFGFMNERFSGTLDVFWNTTKDLLLDAIIPSYRGYSSQMQNVGQTSSKGVELNLNAEIIRNKDFTLGATFNIGTSKLKVDKLSSGQSLWERDSNWASTDLRERTDYRIIVGESVGLMYGYVTDGFYTVDDFTFEDNQWKLKDGIPSSKSILGESTLLPGMLKLKKLNGEPGGEVNADEDRTIIGRASPDFSGGFGLDATWKGFDMSAFFTYMVGFDVYNANKIRTTTRWKYTYDNMLSIVDSNNRFRYFDNMGNDLRQDPEALKELNKNANIWSPSMGRPIIHSWAIEDGSFLRLSTITLGYTLPRKMTKKVGINSLRFYVTGHNLFTWTDYSGYDPEVNLQNGLTPNVDYNKYPRSRTWTCGLNVTF